MVKLVWAGIVGSALILIAGCGSDDNPLTSQNGSTSPIVNPVSQSLSEDFSVTSFTVAKPRNSTSYLYGIAEIQYTGTASYIFVEMFVTYKSSSGAVLFKDSSYLRNVTTISNGKASPIYTNTFVSPQYSKGYYIFIENASFVPGSVAKVEFTFEKDTVTIATPSTQVALSGSPYETSGMLNQNFTTEGTLPVTIETGLILFKNSAGLSYYFTYADSYKSEGTGYIKSDLIDANATGRLSCSKPTSDIETQPYTIKQTLLDWSVVSTLAKKKVMAISDPDERCREFRRQCDRIDNISRQ